MAAIEGQVHSIGARHRTPELFTPKEGRRLDAAVSRTGPPVLDRLDRRLLEACQCDFPICARPFAEIARRLHCKESEVLRRFAALERHGLVSRVGPVFAPGCTGASTLVAMAAPRARLESVGEWVNRHWAVRQICEREHEFNLWFVLEAPNAGELYDALADVRNRSGLDVLDLRLERDYHIDLGCAQGREPSCGRARAATEVCPPGQGPMLDASDRRLVWAIRDGLSLTARPYAAAAERAGLSEGQVMERLRRLLNEGVIKRIGMVVRQDEVDDRPNAMVVFDVPRTRVDIVGERLARVESVTRCYRRTRRPPVWHYNLYCMLHGRDWTEVMGRVDELLPHAAGERHRTVLLSRRRFHQHGPQWAFNHAPAHLGWPARGNIRRASPESTALRAARHPN